MYYADFYYFSWGVAAWVFIVSIIIFVILGFSLVRRINEAVTMFRLMKMEAQITKEKMKFGALSFIGNILSGLIKGGER